MMPEDFDAILPFVRMMRIKRDPAIAGKWQDIDHVYTLITSGSAEFIVGDVKYTLGRGDVILIPPFQTHMIATQTDETLTQLIMHFDFFEDTERRAMVHEDVLESGGTKTVPERERILNGEAFVASFDEETLAYFERLFDRTYDEFKDLCAGGGSPALLRAYCTQLLVETVRQGKREKGPRAESVRSKSWIHVENALRYISDHLPAEDLRNERISQALGVPPNYLTKRFCVYFGMPLHRYVVRLRIEKACQLLLTGRCNVTEAGSAAGFSSIHVFSKTFKAVLGRTPGAYLEDGADEKAILRESQDPGLIERRRRAMV